MSVLVNGDLVDEPDEQFTVLAVGTRAGPRSSDGGLGTILDDDRSGAFICRAIALRMLGLEKSISNPPGSPCKDDKKSLLTLPLGSLTAKFGNTSTNQTPDSLVGTSPALGDRAEADASAATLVVPIGLKTVRASLLTAHAEARCSARSAAFRRRPALGTSRT